MNKFGTLFCIIYGYMCVISGGVELHIRTLDPKSNASVSTIAYLCKKSNGVGEMAHLNPGDNIEQPLVFTNVMPGEYVLVVNPIDKNIGYTFTNLSIHSTGIIEKIVYMRPSTMLHGQLMNLPPDTSFPLMLFALEKSTISPWLRSMDVVEWYMACIQFNPILVLPDGSFDFWAAYDAYDIYVSGNQMKPYQLKPIEILSGQDAHEYRFDVRDAKKLNADVPIEKVLFQAKDRNLKTQKYADELIESYQSDKE